MDKPERLPKEVVDAIKKYCEQHSNEPYPPNIVDMLGPDLLKWHSLMGCYFFIRNNIFHGVEIDGHIHT